MFTKNHRLTSESLKPKKKKNFIKPFTLVLYRSLVEKICMSFPVPNYLNWKFCQVFRPFVLVIVLGQMRLEANRNKHLKIFFFHLKDSKSVWSLGLKHNVLRVCFTDNLQFPFFGPLPQAEMNLLELQKKKKKKKTTDVYFWNNLSNIMSIGRACPVIYAACSPFPTGDIPFWNLYTFCLLLATN